MNQLEPVKIDIPIDAMQTLGLKLGGSFVIGLAIGYVIKKFMKIAIFLIGLQLIIFFVAEYYGIIDVIDASLINAGNGAIEKVRLFWNFIYNRLAQFPAQTVGAIGGLLTGFKQG